MIIPQIPGIPGSFSQFDNKYWGQVLSLASKLSLQVEHRDKILAGECLTVAFLGKEKSSDF